MLCDLWKVPDDDQVCCPLHNALCDTPREASPVSALLFAVTHVRRRITDQTNVWIMQMQVASLIVTVESVKEVRKNIIRRQCCGCSNLALIGMCLGIFNFGVGGLRLLLQLTDTTAGIFKDLNGLVFQDSMTFILVLVILETLQLPAQLIKYRN